MAWNLRLPEELDARLTLYCRDRGAVKNRVIAIALERFLDELPAAEDLAAFAPVAPGMAARMVAGPGSRNARRPRLARSAVCEHRIGPDAFCRVCDA